MSSSIAKVHSSIPTYKSKITNTMATTVKLPHKYLNIVILENLKYTLEEL
jgi:hypothetical protein